jgi:exosortase D (VPLPA-CTERM-specific)
VETSAHHSLRLRCSRYRCFCLYLFDREPVVHHFDLDKFMTDVRKHAKVITSVALLVGSIGFLYRHVIVELIHDWATDDNYSHGFVIVPIALCFAWHKRNRLREAGSKPNSSGLLIIAGSLAVLMLGVLGNELFLTRISILGILSGTIVFLYGWRHLGILAFPIAFLVLMVPIPRIVFDQVVFPLQLLASRLAEITLVSLRVPAVREGNLIVLGSTTIEVAEACSGIRSLITLLTLATVYGYVMDQRTFVRIALMIGMIPVAIVANGFRIAGTALAAHYYSVKAAEAFVDTFSGWILFAIAFVLLFILYRVLLWMFPLKPAVIQEFPNNRAKEQTAASLVMMRAAIVTTACLAAALYVAKFTVTETVTPREPLAALDMEIGRWNGRPAARYDERIVAKLGVDEYLTRFYSRPGEGVVHLYVGYYQSQAEGNSIHSPKNCLPGAGWQPISSGETQIPVGSGDAVKVNRYLIQKGREKQMVLYWYQSHGRVVASEYWAKLYLVMDAIQMNRTDGALVRVISPITDSEVMAEQQLVDFAKTLLPLLDRHLPL